VIVASPPPLICIDPGHGTPPAIGRQAEPIGPGSGVLKITDGGGAAGEAVVNLAIAKKTRTLLLARGYQVAMTRTGPVSATAMAGTSRALSSATAGMPR
jgi:N-acetylmuramoyl-L-alanine amidase